jgi:hypothetical protein
VTHENPVYSELLLKEEQGIEEARDVKEETPLVGQQEGASDLQDA